MNRGMEFVKTPIVIFSDANTNLIPVLSILSFNEGIISFEFYSILFWMQLFFYAAALLGWFLENRETRIKILFVPYYFFIMNLCEILGFFRY
ncbi:hypothetical protein FLAT13_03751 [Flavobacterium salmonis]|uniref:Uncharacterized protein n=2 Tax=Flavobacterium salmonis TaxID=2654844 RepID=A0A6V6Z666_9FLAO|nr:hypothetical protein FLAT13_03751 [Flavobacterium salmonis]